MGESFYTSSYTDIKIHPAVKKYVLEKRNASHVAIMYFEYLNRKKIGTFQKART